MILPKGQGMFIWKIGYCMADLRDEAGLDSIVQKCLDYGIRWAAIKICDGTYEYYANTPFTGLLTAKLFAAGIQVWGWGWTYGKSGSQVIAHWEARKAAELVKKYKMVGFLIDAEHQYKEPGMYSVAQLYSRELRQNIGDRAIGLSSYRYPSYHPQFPWKAWDFDFHSPQVYWEGDNRENAGEVQARRSFSELKAIANKPIVPAGPTYVRGSWVPSAKQRDGFVKALKDEGCPAFLWWSWQHTTDNTWDELKTYNDDPTPPPGPGVPPDALEKLWREAVRREWFNDD